MLGCHRTDYAPHRPHPRFRLSHRIHLALPVAETLPPPVRSRPANRAPSLQLQRQNQHDFCHRRDLDPLQFPRARILFISATHQQVRNQYFQSIKRLADHPLLANWGWYKPKSDTQTAASSSDAQPAKAAESRAFTMSQAAPLACSSMRLKLSPTMLWTRCRAARRLSECSHHPPAVPTTADGKRSVSHPPITSPPPISPRTSFTSEIPSTGLNSCEWLVDDGTSIISLEHVRALLAAQKQAARQSAAPAPTPQPKHPPGALNERGIPYADLERYNRTNVDPIRED